MKLHIAAFLLLSSGVQSKSRKLLREALEHKHVNAESRIVGGTMTDPGKFPFFVGWDGCGASLIHEDIILSAAHCSPVVSNNVYIGAYRRKSLQQDAEFRSIVARRPHPDYNGATVENDFLVMKLDEASTKQPISINPNSSVPYDNEELTVMGFGARREGYSSTNFLREVNVNAVSRETCNGQYNGEIIEDVMLCADVPGGGKDSCQGDSGGPIIDSNGVQVGLVSWGYGCGRPEYPGVYARISGVVEWINDQICELSDNPPDFCSDGPGNNPDPPDNASPAADGTVPVKLILRLDNYPEEAGLLVTSKGGDIVVSHPTGSFSNPGIFTETVNLQPGDYQFKLSDSYGDGFCCGYGRGSFKVKALRPGQNQLLAKSDGQFTNTISVEFSVPSPQTNQSKRDCQDQSGTFLVDSKVGDAGCEWLGVNLIRYSYLCQFLDVAATCPATCDACEFFM